MILSEAEIKRMWLHYFNRYLFTHGIITEDALTKMSALIDHETRSAAMNMEKS